MNSLTIVVPTRERPHHLEPMLNAFNETRRAATLLLFVVDGEDSELDYCAEFERLTHKKVAINAGLVCCAERRRMIGTLNYAVSHVIQGPSFAVGYMGDDHRPVTQGWDSAYLEALHDLGTGMVYGDDGHQGQGLPTQVAMTADIPRALGYTVPPVLNHMYCDNYWLDVASQAGCLKYLPDVKVTHIHPAIHSAGTWDNSYAESNSAASYDRDKTAYEHFVTSGGLASDVEKIRALRGPR